MRGLVLLALTATLALAGCGTVQRPEGPVRPVSGVVIRVDDPRIRANDQAALAALFADLETRLERRDGAVRMLALSGGGANGAYGAGVLYGWTLRGDRPSFDVVTGVSTGALSAPFAFLGPDWDDELREAYVGGATDNLLGARSLSIFRQPSLFDARILRDLVEANVTPDMLAAIAAEHRRGRRLLVVTTNLDTEEPVIWDMGLLATQGGDEALTLFREVLIASASIPGIFPPVLIAGVNDADEIVMEMHVDGGVTAPFLAIPEGMMLWRADQRGTEPGAIYVIVNGQMDAVTGTSPGDISGILMRSYDAMSRSSLRVHLIANAAFADRNGLTVDVTAIPEDITASSTAFDSANMQALFEVGLARAAEGAWTRTQVDTPVVTPPAPAE